MAVSTSGFVISVGRVARIRRKWILDRVATFEYTNLIFQSNFERTTFRLRGDAIAARVIRLIRDFCELRAER